MKKIVSLLLTLMLAVGLLTGCTAPKELYDNEDAIAGGSSAFEALTWAESSLTDDGTIDYTAGATSMSARMTTVTGSSKRIPALSASSIFARTAAASCSARRCR